MSTRCNIVVKDADSEIWFYRHSDGYPSVTGNSLRMFLRWLLDGHIRDNVEQAAGWLIILGHMEYSSDCELPPDYFAPIGRPSKIHQMGWKVGAYEPSCGCHGDIEYAYVVDLAAKEVRCYLPKYKKIEGESFGGSVFDPDHPGAPILVITEKNIDQEIEDKISEKV